jgi:hypothetical protein
MTRIIAGVSEKGGEDRDEAFKCQGMRREKKKQLSEGTMI